MAAVELPEVIVVEEILPRLPVKTLLRFKSVCKTWQALITSPLFINQHLNQSLSMLSSSSSSPFLALIDHALLSLEITVDKPHRLTSKIPLNLQDEEHGLKCKRPTLLACGCGRCGVYCMVQILGDRAVIWNPATRETKRVPWCNVIQDKETILNFKLVAFSCSMDQQTKVRDFKLMSFFFQGHILKVYTMSTNSWTSTRVEAVEFRRIFSELYIAQYCGVANLHNKAHWLVQHKETWLKSILFFDFQTESFGIIKVPHDHQLVNIARDKIILTLFDNKFLCLITCRDIWVLREYGDLKHPEWVPHSFVPVVEKLSSGIYQYVWSSRDEDEDEDGNNGIIRLFSYREDGYYLNSSELGLSGFRMESRQVLNIVNNVSSLVPLEHVQKS